MNDMENLIHRAWNSASSPENFYMFWSKHSDTVLSHLEAVEIQLEKLQKFANEIIEIEALAEDALNELADQGYRLNGRRVYVEDTMKRVLAHKIFDDHDASLKPCDIVRHFSDKARSIIGGGENA